MLTDADTSLVHLDSEALIRVSGPDTVAFLQGQLSTDVEKLANGMSQFSSWSNAKGRVISLLRVFRRGDDILMSLPAGLKASVLKRLSMYVLRSKLTLTDAADLAGMGLVGDAASALLTQADIPIPSEENALTEGGGIQAIRLHGTPPRFAFYGSAEALKAKFSNATKDTEDRWALHKILAGEPTVYTETSEHFVAQMLDLEKLGGIDFKKGCYTGQEVIARSHYRGGVKRHLIRASSHTEAALKPGMEIHAKDHVAAVAEVVDARLDAHGVCQMLMVIQDDARQMELVHAASGARVMLN